MMELTQGVIEVQICLCPAAHLESLFFPQLAFLAMTKWPHFLRAVIAPDGTIWQKRGFWFPQHQENKPSLN